MANIILTVGEAGTGSFQLGHGCAGSFDWYKLILGTMGDKYRQWVQQASFQPARGTIWHETREYRQAGDALGMNEGHGDG